MAALSGWTYSSRSAYDYSEATKQLLREQEELMYRQLRQSMDSYQRREIGRIPMHNGNERIYFSDGTAIEITREMKMFDKYPVARGYRPDTVIVDDLEESTPYGKLTKCTSCGSEDKSEHAHTIQDKGKHLVTRCSWRQKRLGESMRKLFWERGLKPTL